MKPFRCLTAVVFVLASVDAAFSQPVIFPQPLSPRIANYKISVTLDATKKMLKGTEVLTWRNTSKDKIRELQFHLYLNAFKNSESTFMKESGGQNRGFEIGKDGWGWIDVDAMNIVDGEELKSKMEFIHPDDDNAKDQTVVRVPLSRPLRPNQTLTLSIAFTAKLPTVFARTGYNQNYFFVGQWFPKIGVYEPAGMRFATVGQWNCHQFHANSEFYADFGVYDVDMTVPNNFVVGATGLLVEERKASDTTKTVAYHAEDVHDFSWTASPLFKVVEDQWRHVKIRLLVQPDHVSGSAARYLRSAKAALQYFNDWIGEYPYPNLTIVDPQYGAMGSGGMEYPTLITGETFWGIPEGLRFVEVVTVHEFGHQYWYGLVASNEFEEAWLDEGINQYSETRIMDAVYGEKTSAFDLCGFRTGDFEFSRYGYTGMTNPKLAPTFQRAWDYKVGGYGSMTYMKTATFMTTLERMIGRPAMDEIMRTYFERWKFKHPCSKDFIAVVNEIVPKYHGEKFGKDLNWFFDQVLYGTDVCDYALESISSHPVSKPSGIVDMEGKKVSVADAEKNESKKEYETKVIVYRLGEITMPVDVLIHFADGSDIREHWDGKARWQEFKLVKPVRAEWAKVDPDQVLTIDINMNNNSKTLEPESAPYWKYALKMLYWVQNAIQYSQLF